MLTHHENSLNSGTKDSQQQPSGHATVAAAGGSVRFRILQMEWLGQMAASLCWIASVLCYGISSTGDWLQLAAAGSWLLANVAALSTNGDK